MPSGSRLRRAVWGEKRREDRLRTEAEAFRYAWDEAMHTPDVLVARALRAFELAARRSHRT